VRAATVPRAAPIQQPAGFPYAADIAVDIFQRERQLVGIKALGATAELRALKLLDDGLKTLDLAVSMLNGRGDVADKAMQKCRIRQQNDRRWALA
jgi:hypothetical protein